MFVSFRPPAAGVRAEDPCKSFHNKMAAAHVIYVEYLRVGGNRIAVLIIGTFLTQLPSILSHRRKGD